MLELADKVHWWRHYYIENVTLDADKRSISVWFDFPSEQEAEYAGVVAELQLPWIEAEIQRHNSVLLENGCHWFVRQEVRSKPYSDVVAMPEEVLTAMLKQLSSRRRAENEAQQLATLTLFKEAQPSVRRRISSLKERKSDLDAGAYLSELGQIADDLYELGGRSSARSLLYLPYLKNLKHLSFKERLQLGLRLLEWEVDAGSHFEAIKLLKTLSPEFDELPNSDDRKWRYTRLRIEALNMSCAYLEAKTAIVEALDLVPTSERLWLNATLSEMELLQGDFGSGEG